MYSVMIVDDEEPALDSYAFMIENDAPEFTLCAKARNGFEAIAMAHQKRPDIVVMDIGIPGMDGLDTIGELQKVYPETLFILSTAYERFDLAQRAIPLGVVEYLVKPISRKTFLDTLSHARDLTESRKQRSTHRLASAQLAGEARDVEQRGFLDLSTWKGLGETEWARYRALFSLSSDYGYLILVQIRADDPGERYAAVINRFSRKYQCLSAEHRDRLLLFVSDIAGANRAEESLREIIDAVLADGEHGAIGAGSRRRFDEFYRSYDEAIAALPTPAGNSAEADSRSEITRSLRTAVARASSFDDVLPAFTRYWDTVFSQEPFPVAKGRMVALFSLLLEDLGDRLGDRTAAQFVDDPVREITAIETLQDWTAWGSRTLRTLVERNLRNRKQHWPAPLARAVNHVENHYEQPLQLSLLAEQCGVSAGYLSRLFSEHLSTNFADFLNSIRIKVAEQELRNNRLSVKEIAYTVGYQDPNYFSRIFKKHKGISPTTYLSRGTENEE